MGLLKSDNNLAAPYRCNLFGILITMHPENLLEQNNLDVLELENTQKVNEEIQLPGKTKEFVVCFTLKVLTFSVLVCI